MAATSIGNNQFISQPNLSGIALPYAKNIGTGAFQVSPLKTLSLPEVQTIQDRAFQNSHLTSLSFPKAITIGANAFGTSVIENLFIPKVTTIGNGAFHGIFNSANTHVTISSAFNTPGEKDRIFGVRN